MSCCPAIPTVEVIDVQVDEPVAGTEVQRHPGETEDCYYARLGNRSGTGQVDDKTEPVPNTIVQNAIVPDEHAKIDMTFTTVGPLPVTSWVFNPASFPGVTCNTSTGKVSGTFDVLVHHTRLLLRVQAMNGTDVLDDRTYAFSPSIYDPASTIKLTHPLPGSRVTSPFGKRRPPTAGGSSNHQGIDLAYADRSTKDVICAADGIVVHAGPGTGYGNYVVVKHGDPGGRHLCTTVYAHLASIYVNPAQKLAGGQSLGKEGSSGVSSGAHLHFEVRMPNGVRVDPQPYLDGTTVTPNTGVTATEIAARQGCEPFGATYPTNNIPSSNPDTSQDVSTFELGWQFILKHEVGPLWNTSAERSPTDPEVAAGLIDTASQRERVGYVNSPRDPGGITKFGVAQRYNPNVNVTSATYSQARQAAYNVYWISRDVNCGAISSAYPKLALLLFDMNFTLGGPGCKAVLTKAGIDPTATGLDQEVTINSLTDARITHLKKFDSLFKVFGTGWTKRANEARDFALAS